MKIGIVNPSSTFGRDRGDALAAWIEASHPDGSVSAVIHPVSFSTHGHFAGEDAARADAFVDFANDPDIDAIWFARGGYGSCRIAETAVARLNDIARRKRYLGFSDSGSILAALYKAGFPHVAHGPLASDAPRNEAAARRAIAWLTTGDESTLEPSLVGDPRPAVAFNLTVLGSLMGTALEPDLSGHVVMLEEVSEALYRVDRMMFHLTGQASMKRIAGIRLGRVSDVTPNDPDFGLTPEEIVRHWCARSGIPYLGAADIGHDGGNKVVPFGPR